ncbi:MAG: amidohydrolase [Kiritimatiellae bacterium]|nr:amidohydrolase [Kiritimatiellia bacterium]
MRSVIRLFLCAAAGWLSYSGPVRAVEPADAIYSGGDIVTVNDAQPSAEALAVKDGRIAAIGALDEVLKFRGEGTRMVDLDGRTLLPGFIDPHSHVAAYETGWGLPVLNPPPVGDVTCIADLVAKLKAYVVEKQLPGGALVLGNGYDDGLLAEKRHPTRADLDRVSTNHPVLIVHASGHLLVANSLALQKVGITKDTPDPAGGVIRRDANGEPNGVMEELAALPFLKLIVPRSMDEQIRNLEEVLCYYASLGITTAQDGISMPENIALLNEAARRNTLILDVVSYPRWDFYNDVLSGERKLDIEYHFPGDTCDRIFVPASGASAGPEVLADGKGKVGIYVNRLKYAGIKITGDGSPQGKTAYLTKPYVHPPEGQPADYRGYPTVTQDELDRWFDAAYEHNVQILVHCNGDAAADQMIAAVRKAVEKHGKKDLRPVMIHAQMIRHDQVDAMAELGIIPSFFTAHTFYWGDWHINETVGPERAFGMSPCAYALKKGLRFTNHTDASVVPPSHLMAMWTAVNRLSRSGVVVGPDERISALDALKAVTINAARQYFEEKEKGSLEVGKLADLVILDRNPLKVDPLDIKDIRVLETIKEGRTIYRAGR